MITWSFSHVLREYMVKVRIIKDGMITEVDATSGRESFRFRACGMDEVLECAITQRHNYPSKRFLPVSGRAKTQATAGRPGRLCNVEYGHKSGQKGRLLHVDEV